MRTDYTHILYILDKSGSMGTVANDVRHGFDNFVAEQKRQPGKCTLSLVQFSDVYEKTYEFKDIQEVPLLDFYPTGFTALLDAIGKGISETGKTLAQMSEHERPAKVIVMIHTDGEENASKEYQKVEIGDMIKHQEQKYQWKIAFIGTQFDVIGEAQNLNIAAASTLAYTNNSKGIADAYMVMTRAVNDCRSATMDVYSSTEGIFKPEEQNYVKP